MIPALQPPAAHLQVLTMSHFNSSIVNINMELDFSLNKHVREKRWPHFQTVMRRHQLLQQRRRKKLFMFILAFFYFLEEKSNQRKNISLRNPIKIKPLSIVGNPRHSSDVYMHADHSLSFVDTSFHITVLDGKGPMNCRHSSKKVHAYHKSLP